MIELAVESREEIRLSATERDRQARAEWERLRALDEPLLDEDGYPTDHAQQLVETWHHSDPPGWFEFIKSIWHLADWGWREDIETSYSSGSRPVRIYKISTAGWSGNEGLIRSMQKNWLLWHDSWVQSRRGGHYIFEIELDTGSKLDNNTVV